MIREHEDELVCDLAETYGIFDYRAQPATLIATLALGLRSDSRVRLAFAGQNVSNDTLLLAAAVDDLAFLAWTKTKNARKNVGRPRSIVDALTKRQKGGGTMAFDTPEEFEAARQKIIKGAISDGN